jgi:hypothetical protein
MSPRILRFIGVAALLFGAWLSYYGMRVVRAASASNGWPSIEGEVMESQVVYTREGDRDYDPYVGRVLYAYWVDEVSYTSDQIAFGMRQGRLPILLETAEERDARARRLLNNPRSITDEGHPGRYVQGYRPGKKITVYYNPSDPSVAVLVPGINPYACLPLGAGVFLAFVGLFLVTTGRPVG